MGLRLWAPGIQDLIHTVWTWDASCDVHSRPELSRRESQRPREDSSWLGCASVRGQGGGSLPEIA